MWEILLSVLGGLALFLYAVSALSESIRRVLDKKAEGWILKFTGTLTASIATGAIVTTLMDSSSAVIIITIILVNSKMLSFRQSMGIVLGANLGTTVSSQIIALNVAMFSPIILTIGLVFYLIGKGKQYAQTVLYFGMLFFGLFIMEEAVEPLKNSPVFFDWMAKMDDPLTGTLTGAVVTLILQSSSATVGMALVLAKKGLISLSGGIAVMLGAELGTVSDTLLATINGSREAIKTGLFHLIFNLLSIIGGLILFYPFYNLVEWMSSGATVERSIANAHMLFNSIGILCFVWFVPMFERFLNMLLPNKEAVIATVSE